MTSGWPTRNRNRYDSLKSEAHYDCRVVRSVDKNQDELARSLRQLKDATGEFVEYKWSKRSEELGRLGVTLAKLNPVARDILDIPRRGKIRREDWRQFETDLNEHLEPTRFQTHTIALDSENPLGLYGKNNEHLALRLDPNDSRVAHERKIIDTYLKETYHLPNGGELSDEFLNGKLLPIDPHITIGKINYMAMGWDKQLALEENPSQFIQNEMTNYVESLTAEKHYYRTPTIATLPETVSLNGLQIWCQSNGT